MIYGTDYAFATLGQRVTALATVRAPHVRFQLLQHTPAIVENASDGLRTADAILLPHGFLPSTLPHMDVVRDRWVFIVARDNSAVGEALTMDVLRELPWVVNYRSRTAYAPPIRQLELLGVEPNVETVVEGFLTLPYLVAGSGRIAMIQESIARPVMDALDLRVLDPPFEAISHVGALWWHPIHDRDPAHVWMRDLFRESAVAPETPV